MKIRATEEFEEIELGGHGTGTAEQPLAPSLGACCVGVRGGAGGRGRDSSCVSQR